MFEWLRENQTLLTVLFVLSLASLALTAILLPMILVRLPEDYFSREPGEHRREGRSRGNLLWHVAKNVLGVTFVLAGIAMLVLPGQGVLTILIGVLMLDFPGKYRLERWIVKRPSVQRMMNKLRARFDRAPLRFEGE